VADSMKINDAPVGATAPVVTHTLTRTDLVRYAGASGDFNPLHHDELAAQAAGLPSVFGHGMFTMGLLGRALTGFVGATSLKTFRVRFTNQTWPGEELSTRVTVVARRHEGIEELVDLELTVTNGEGQAKAVGTATAVVSAER